MIDTTGRHPGTQQIARWFDWHLAELSDARRISDEVAELAGLMIRELPDGPELTAGLRKLLEAKDCFVRAATENETPAR